jgi:hypothetical protein
MRTQAQKEHIMRLAHDSTATGCLAVVVVLDVTSGEGRPLRPASSATMAAGGSWKRLRTTDKGS